VFRLKNERFRWFINGYSQTQGKNWYQDVWQADISGYPSLCNDYFGRGPQFVDLFDVFMVQLFFETNGSVVLLWTEEERFLTVVDSSRWQVILGCSSRRDGNTQISCYCVSKNLKICWKIEVHVQGNDMLALLVLPQWWKAQGLDRLCRHQSQRLWNFAVLFHTMNSFSPGPDS
jgi:hypothetical protein